MLRNLVCGLAVAAGGLAVGGCEYPTGAAKKPAGTGQASGEPVPTGLAADKAEFLRLMDYEMQLLKGSATRLDEEGKKKYDAFLKALEDARAVAPEKFEETKKKLLAMKKEIPPPTGLGYGKQ